MPAILDAVCLFSILKLGHTLSLHISTNNFYFLCQNFAVVSTLLNFVRIFRKAHDENRKQAELEKKKAQKEAETEKSKEANIAKNVSRWHLVCLPLHDFSPCAWDTCCFGQQPSICADNLRNCFRICTTLVRGNWIAPHLRGNKVVSIAHSTLLCTFMKDSKYYYLTEQINSITNINIIWFLHQVLDDWVCFADHFRQVCLRQWPIVWHSG